MAVLFVGRDELVALQTLALEAAERPIDVVQLLELIEQPAGKAAHMERMTAQTVEIPHGFMVTYSVETGHPAGTCRHMSMSTASEDKLPSPDAVWAVADILGFKGVLADCAVWIEDLRGHGKAINLVQPVDFEV